MIKLIVNKEGKFDTSKSRLNLRKGEQYFRNIQIITPRKIQCIDVTNYDVKLLIRKNREKYSVDLKQNSLKSDKENLVFYQDIFKGFSSNANELELGIMWIKGEKQYISNIVKVKIDNSLLERESKDISDFLEGYKLEIDSITNISKQVELAENKRQENEKNRIKEEVNRLSKFDDWIKKFDEFIQKNEVYGKNDIQRTTNMNKINSDWNKLKTELSGLAVSELSKNIEELKTKSLNHVKNLVVNISSNTLDVYFEKDGSTPSLKLQLPKGFTGNYNDLTGKPELTNLVREIDRKTDSIGTYVVYSNGMAEYIGNRTANVEISRQYAGLFTGDYEWIFPIKFTSRPAVSLTEGQWTTGASWGVPQWGSTPLLSVNIKLIDVASRARASTRLGIYVRGFVDLKDYKI